MRRQIAALPGFDISRLDNLERYAFAAGHAHMLFQMASGPPEIIVELSVDLQQRRGTFISDIQALARRGLMDAAPLQTLRGPTGYKNIAFDVAQLVAMLRAQWSTIAGKTGVTEEELREAESLASQLATAAGIKEQGPSATSTVSLTRQRAFTLFYRTYDAVRRAVAYLRWNEGDADTIAPSLYANRKQARKADGQPEPEPAPVPMPIASVVPVVGPGLPGMGRFRPRDWKASEA